jgi:hypothetical protein
MSKNIHQQTDAMKKLRLPELQAKYAEVTGEKTRSPNKTFLIRKITESLQGRGAVAVASPGVEAATAVPPKQDGPATERLTRLDVPELQARYLEVVGRPSGSTSKSYLVWKIREARKGRVPVGPRRNARREGVTFKVLPLRMETTVVDKLDEAWKRQGLHSRTELFRKSLQTFLASQGEVDVAAMVATGL